MTDHPSLRRRSASRRACVLLPDPSKPSTTMKHPRVSFISAVSVTSLCPRILVRQALPRRHQRTVRAVSHIESRFRLVVQRLSDFRESQTRLQELEFVRTYDDGAELTGKVVN